MPSSPNAPRCANWSRGCLITRADFGEPMTETCTPGSPAYVEGQRIGALSHERKQNVQQELDAAKSTRPEGRFGNQQVLSERSMVRFEGGPPARDGGRNPRCDAAGPGGKGGGGKSGRHRGGGGGGYGRYGGGRRAPKVPAHLVAATTAQVRRPVSPLAAARPTTRSESRAAATRLAIRTPKSRS